jgi:outer membrane protein
MLAEVNYGPVILSVQYHFNDLGPVHPYLGLGVGRIVFLNERDRALTTSASTTVGRLRLRWVFGTSLTQHGC